MLEEALDGLSEKQQDVANHSDAESSTDLRLYDVSSTGDPISDVEKVQEDVSPGSKILVHVCKKFN